MYPSVVKHGGGIYCSRSCNAKGNHAGGKLGEYTQGRCAIISKARLDKTRRKYPDLFNKDFMINLYVTKQYSLHDVADTIGCSTQAVLSALKRLEIPMRNLSEANNTDRYLDKYRKDNNWMWKGGQIDYKGGDWGKQKRLARKRDNNICQCCGITNNGIGKNMPVHHIIPFALSHDNSLLNLVSLCPSCHSKAEALLRKIIKENPNKEPIDLKILIDTARRQVSYRFNEVNNSGIQTYERKKMP